MNKLLMPILIFFAGCATPQPKSTDTYADIQESARVGAERHLAEYPDNTVYFGLTIEALIEALERHDATSESLVRALEEIPIDELRGPAGTIRLGGSLTTFEPDGGKPIPLDSKLVILASMVAIRNGLMDALGYD